MIFYGETEECDSFSSKLVNVSCEGIGFRIAGLEIGGKSWKWILWGGWFLWEDYYLGSGFEGGGVGEALIEEVSNGSLEPFS